MKKLIALACFACALWLASCSNDFEVAAPWKDIPVVYGLLNIDDAVHYIRVERAFLDPERDAFEIARIPDSIYYTNAVVKLLKVNTGQEFTLGRVDGNLVGLPRDSGVFAESPNWLYRIDSTQLSLSKGDSIQIMIDRGNGLPLVTAGCSVIERGVQRTPKAVDGNFLFPYNLPVSIKWSASANAKIYDISFIIKYAEYLNTPIPVPVEKSIEWIWGKGIRPQLNGNSYEVVRENGAEFYQLLKANIPVNPGMVRVFLGIDIVIIGGGSALERYVTIASANSGITGSQEIPIYSNLSEGRGVFSSINYLITEDVLLHNTSRDSLRLGIYTKDLNF